MSESAVHVTPIWTKGGNASAATRSNVGPLALILAVAILPAPAMPGSAQIGPTLVSMALAFWTDPARCAHRIEMGDRTA